MPDLVPDPGLVARCGLYCGACRSHLSGRCPGCRQNAKATWCTVRACCADRGFASCAECADFPDPRACPKFNNFMARLFGVVFRSNRAACIAQIRNLGLEGHARAMAAARTSSLRR